MLYLTWIPVVLVALVSAEVEKSAASQITILSTVQSLDSANSTSTNGTFVSPHDLPTGFFSLTNKTAPACGGPGTKQYHDIIHSFRLSFFCANIYLQGLPFMDFPWAVLTLSEGPAQLTVGTLCSTPSSILMLTALGMLHLSGTMYTPPATPTTTWRHTVVLNMHCR